MSTFGLSEERNGIDGVYEGFVGKTGHYQIGPGSCTGVLRKLDLGAGYASFLPSLVGVGDEVRVEEEDPTVMSIPDGCQIIRRPLKESDLAKIAKGNGDQAPKNDANSKYLLKP